jgi:hypothetical protein
MAALTMHTLSYLLLDQAAAAEIRLQAEKQLVEVAQKLSEFHGSDPMPGRALREE